MACRAIKLSIPLIVAMFAALLALWAGGTSFAGPIIQQPAEQSLPPAAPGPTHPDDPINHCTDCMQPPGD